MALAGTATTVRVDGIRDLIRRLKNVEDGIAELKATNKRAADVVGLRSLQTAPNRTGRLAVTMRTSATQRSGVVRFGYASVPYSCPVHWGWVTRPNAEKHWRGGPIKPNAWASRAAQETEPVWYEAYVKDIETLWDKV